MNVVNMRESPSLVDIAGQLRQLADKIEQGDESVETCYAVVVHSDTFVPSFFMWGKPADKHGIAGLFTHLAVLAVTDRSDED